jgi:transcriptional regulator with XRE-family HTH domain
METGLTTGDRFRHMARAERERRKWSQADVARKLTERGIDKIHHTTVAKVESGEREVKLDEAVAIADLFGLPLDVMLGRRQFPLDNESALHVSLQELRNMTQLQAANARQITIDLNDRVDSVMFARNSVSARYAELDRLAALADLAYQSLDDLIKHLTEMAQQANRIVDERQGANE